MSLPQLRNMVLCAEAGAVILPAMPAFYQLPKTLDDLADFMAGKILRRSASTTTSIRRGRAGRAVSRSVSASRDRRDPRQADRLNRSSTRDELTVTLSKSPDAHRGDVRRDRRALRPPQPPAQRRHRSPLAAARDPLARADRVRARARPLHGHRRSRDRGARRAARAPRASSASTSPARCCASGSRSCGARGLRRPVTLVRGDATRIPVADRVGRRGDDRVRHPQRREHGGGLRRDPPRARRRRPARHPRVRDSDHARAFARLYLWYFNQVLPRIGRLVSRHNAAYGYLPASVGAFASPDEFVKILRQSGFDGYPARPADLRHRLSVYGPQSRSLAFCQTPAPRGGLIYCR